MAGVPAQLASDQQGSDQIGVIAGHAAGRKKLVAEREKLLVIDLGHFGILTSKEKIRNPNIEIRNKLK